MLTPILYPTERIRRKLTLLNQIHFFNRLNLPFMYKLAAPERIRTIKESFRLPPLLGHSFYSWLWLLNRSSIDKHTQIQNSNISYCFFFVLILFGRCIWFMATCFSLLLFFKWNIVKRERGFQTIMSIQSTKRHHHINLVIKLVL